MASHPTVADRVLGSGPLHRRQLLGRFLSWAAADVEVTGLDNIPERGPVVLAMNHRAFVDGPLVFSAVARPVTCLVKAEAFTPGWGPVLLGAGQLPIRRGVIDTRPVRQCLRILRGGGVVGIFPEGQRGDGLVLEARPGAAYLAMRASALVVPVAFHGSQHIGHALRPSVRVAIGEGFRLPAVGVHERLPRRVVAEQAEVVRAALAGFVAQTAPTAAPSAGPSAPALH